MKLVSDQIDERELRVITRELKATLAAGVAGEVVEFGCYVGTTSLYLQRELVGTNRHLHVYDSFAGLPEKSTEDSSPAGEQFKAGELTASKAQFIKNFKQAGLPLPTIHKGWFAELLPSDVPNHIAFAFLDGDYFDSILDPLKLIWPRLSSGAIVVIDDYHNEQLPGVQRAVQLWAQSHQFQVRAEASLAIIHID